MFTVINNRKELKEFIKSTEEHFDCQEYLEEFYGFELDFDDDGNLTETIDEYEGEFKYCPSEKDFPVIAYSVFDNDGNFRMGSMDIKVFDWVKLKDLNLGGTNV